MGFLGNMYSLVTDLVSKPVSVSVSVLDAVYLDSDGVYKAALADNIDTAKVIGFVVSKDNATTATIRKSGKLEGFTSLTIGGFYYLDATVAGGISSTIVSSPGHVRIGLGVALSSTELLIDISLLPSIIIRA